MELTSKDDYEDIKKEYKVIKKQDKEVSLEEEPLSPIADELLENCKAPSSNVNLTDRYNNLEILPSQTPLAFCFTTSSPVTMRNESLDYHIRLL